MQEHTRTPTWFRAWRGDIIALFPYDWDSPRDLNMVWSYMTVGQHGVANLQAILQDSTAASESAYTPLWRELGTVGYDVAPIAQDRGYSSPQTAAFVARARIAEPRLWATIAQAPDVLQALKTNARLWAAAHPDLPTQRERQLIAWHEVVQACLGDAEGRQP